MANGKVKLTEGRSQSVVVNSICADTYCKDNVIISDPRILYRLCGTKSVAFLNKQASFECLKLYRILPVSCTDAMII